LFTLSGTATREVDYLMWERAARFEPGSSTAFITALPRNDTEQEPAETIVLKLSPSTEYTVGTPASATVQIGDFGFGTAFPGAWDWADAPLGLQKDLIYLEARVAGSYLLIRTGLNAATMSTVHIWVDADQNPDTGDIRQGHAAGPEYRIERFVFFAPDYQVWRLPTSQADCQDPACPEQSVIRGAPPGPTMQACWCSQSRWRRSATRRPSMCSQPPTPGRPPNRVFR
jgi:hypothetical protein